MDVPHLALVGGAALIGGAVNAIAGGGSLITFPALVAAGLPAVTASVTNTVALCPGYLGATLAQRRDLAGQGKRAAIILPLAALGGAAGALLLLHTGEALFDVLVPVLILAAVALLAAQDRIRAFILARTRGTHREGWAALPIGLAAIYGGYFGAGLGVMILAALGAIVEDNLIRLNALKQSVSLVVNVTAALVFVALGGLDWLVVLVMASGALAGGALGGAVAARVSARVLRFLVIAVGLVVSIVYVARL